MAAPTLSRVPGQGLTSLAAPPVYGKERLFLAEATASRIIDPICLAQREDVRKDPERPMGIHSDQLTLLASLLTPDQSGHPNPCIFTLPKTLTAPDLGLIHI